LDQLDALDERAQRARGQLQHLFGGVDADEAPTWVGFRHGLQLEPAASTQHKHRRVTRRALCQQDARHEVERIETRHETPWSFGVPRHGLGSAKELRKCCAPS
jgi:hypothetical protein